MQPEESAGDRAADHRGDRNRCHEQRHDAGALCLRKPIGEIEIENDAREETGLGDAEQKPQGIEARRAGDEAHGGRHQAPADHDARDPDARAEFVQSEIARNLEEDIAHEKDAGAEAEDLRREAEIFIHGERGEADIDAVEEIDRVAEDEKRDQAPARLANGAFRGIPRHGFP
jgi:hypothetical protein